MLECVSDNNHCTGERREMSTQNLPAASLRTGNRLPASRVLLQVSKYLVWMALSSIYSSIRGAVSIFLPEAGRPGHAELVDPQGGWLFKQGTVSLATSKL